MCTSIDWNCNGPLTGAPVFGSTSELGLTSSFRTVCEPVPRWRPSTAGSVTFDTTNSPDGGSGANPEDDERELLLDEGAAAVELLDCAEDEEADESGTGPRLDTLDALDALGAAKADEELAGMDMAELGPELVAPAVCDELGLAREPSGSPRAVLDDPDDGPGGTSKGSGGASNGPGVGSGATGGSPPSPPAQHLHAHPHPQFGG